MFNVTGILVEKTFSSTPPCPEHTGRQWVVIIPCFLFSLTGGQDDHLLHSLKKVLKELVSNKTMFGCFSPFKIGTHSSLKTSDWTDLKRKYFWKCVGSIYFWLSHSRKKIWGKIWILKGLKHMNTVIGRKGRVLFGTKCQILS